ncbi:MAG TPA: GMC family oxidoreductase N-terminal domain-containing protein [Solirubrobacteraceae bacterium]
MRLADAVSMEPDYVVVGAGPAGCVVAGRLSEDPAVKVLLLEAGRSADDPRVRIPVGVAMLVENKNWDWSFRTPPDPTINGRHMTWSAGKCLGGGSSIHGQVNIRGLPSDYDEWAELVGQDGAWSYADLLPYFVKCESYEGADSDARGSSGPLAVSDIRDRHPLADAFVGAGEDCGYPRVDLNGATPCGFGFTQATQKDGRRFNAYDGYIRPHTGRQNLAVMTKARVRRVLLEGASTIGVEVEQGGRTATVRARREVIVCAGAISSANLLMKSGIGPGDVLQAAGVPVEVALAGVGRNLQEHTGVSVSRFITGHWSLNTMRRPRNGLVGMYKLLVKRRGPLASPVVQAMGFAKTDPALDRPDVQLHFLPFAYRMTPDAHSALTAEMPKRAAVAMQVTLCKPKTRGQVRIADSDPLSAPVIDHQLLGEPHDLSTLVAGCKLLTRLFASDRFAEAVVTNCNPPVDPATTEAWEDYVRASANVAYHHAGTCRMGPASDPTSVVDPSLRVIGAGRLRVVDAGVMPVVPSSNTYIPTIAVAEKAADLIKHP